MVLVPDAQDPGAVPSLDVSGRPNNERIHLLKQLTLGLSSTYYSMAQVLGLRRLQGLLSGAKATFGCTSSCTGVPPF